MFWLTIGFLAYGQIPFVHSPAVKVSFFAAALAIYAISVLGHELGHAVAVLALGRSAKITLHAFGGQTEPGSSLAEKALWKQLLVVASGPLAGLSLAAVAFGAFFVGARLNAPVGWLLAFRFLASTNLMWSLVNLLPIMPMDGGRMLAMLAQRWYGVKGLRFTHGLALAFAGAGLLYALYTHSQYNALIFAMFGSGSLSALKELNRRSPADDDPALQEEFAAAHRALVEGKAEEAIRRFIRVRRSSRAGRLHDSSTEVLGLLFLESGRFLAAYRLLGSVAQDRLSGQSLIALQRLSCRFGKFEAALKIGRTLFPQGLDPSVAYWNARASAGLDNDGDAIRWLKTAARRGFRDPNALSAPEFARLRARTEFSELERDLR